jgi:hypothetical protein
MTDSRTSDQDVNRVIRSWLHEDRHEDASRLAGAVLDNVEATPRRRTTLWPARRTSHMNKIAGFGLAAAAVVAVVLIGAQLLGSPGGGTGGPGDEPSPSLEASITVPTSEPSPSVHGGLPEGPHLLVDADGDPENQDDVPPLTVTIPGPGWEGDVGAGILFRDVNEPVDDAGMIVFRQENYLVFADPCRWESTDPISVATVDEFVAALTAQPGRDASEPVDITIDGYSGKAITLHIADDADFSECDQNTFGTWDCYGPAAPRPCGFTGGPGETSVDYILDVDGVLVAWHTGYQAGTPADIVAEQETLVLSATFGE